MNQFMVFVADETYLLDTGFWAIGRITEERHHPNI